MPSPILAKRIWYHYPYVLSDTVLSAEAVDSRDRSSLRQDASRDGRCYLHVIHAFGDGTFLCRVAAHPERIRTHGYTLVLTEVQFAAARPYDCRVQRAA